MPGTASVERVDRLARLEVDVGVLGRAAQHRAVGRERAAAVGADQLVVDHGAHIVIGQLLDLLHLVGGAEAVEEVEEGDARFEGGGLGDQGEVHDLLHELEAQHGPAGLADGHDVLVIAEDGERLGGDGAGGNVEDGRRQFAGDLVHVGDHQQQPLDAVKVVASEPACRAPWTAPAAPPSLCISMTLGMVPQMFGLPSLDH